MPQNASAVALKALTAWWEEMGVDMAGSWWGYYGVSPDNSPIIGRHPDEEAWIDACGFSGHGIMHAPASGRAIAELILTGTYQTLDLSAFRYGRIPEGRPYKEIGIV